MADYNTFPIYKVDAIVTFFRTEVFTGQEAKKLFCKNDLTPNPNPEAVCRLYMRVLQLLFRFRPECHYMVPLSENIQNPEFLEGATAVMSVYLRMRQFLPMCYVHDFSLSDLLAPKLKRTLFVLSGIMNFLHFRKQRLLMAVEHQERFRADMDKLQFYTRGIKDAERKIEKLTTIPPEQQAEAKELATALSDLQTANVHELQEINGLKEQIAEGKTECAERSQKLSQLKVDVTTLKDNIGKLKSQIVESPEEMKVQMEKMKETVRSIKLSRERADERLVELQMAVQGVSHNEAEVQLLYKSLQDLQGSMAEAQQHQKEAQELEAQYAEQLKELKKQSGEEAQLKRAQAMKTDKDFKQQMRRQKNKEMNEQHVQDVMGQCTQVHQKREEMADQIQQITVEAQQVQSKIQNLRDACNEETEKAQALFDNLLASLDEFHKGIEIQFVEGNNDLEKMKKSF